MCVKSELSRRLDNVSQTPAPGDLQQPIFNSIKFGIKQCHNLRSRLTPCFSTLYNPNWNSEYWYQMAPILHTIEEYPRAGESEKMQIGTRWRETFRVGECWAEAAANFMKLMNWWCRAESRSVRDQFELTWNCFLLQNVSMVQAGIRDWEVIEWYEDELRNNLACSVYLSLIFFLSILFHHGTDLP